MDFKCCFRICVDGTPLRLKKEAAVIAIADEKMMKNLWLL
jgi:hypothetical protein